MKVSTNRPKKRGRPRKEIPKIFIGGSPDLKALSNAIAAELEISPSPLTDKLSHVGVSFMPMTDLQRNAPLKRKGKGNRSKIHLAALLRDCAIVFQAESGQLAESELQKIGGWEEEGNAAKSKVLIYAKAILAALGISHAQSLRHQARRAIELL